MMNDLQDNLIQELKKDGLTYLSEEALVAIKNTVKQIEDHSINGVFIETGCALGGSAILIALNKKMERPLFVYDVFGMIPAPSDQDGADVISRYEVIKSGKSEGINNEKYYGYEEDLMEKVTGNFRHYGIELNSFNISLVRGLYQDTLKIDKEVAFAHIDCDWYESVMICLQEIVPNLSVGGRIIIDDYYAWSGCRKATDEYFENKLDHFRLFDVAGKKHAERFK